MAIRCLVTVFAAGAFIYALTIPAQGLPSPTRLGVSNSILAPLRLPGGASIGVIPSGGRSIIANNLTPSVGIAGSVHALRK
jgi:hypothetical protein